MNTRISAIWFASVAFALFTFGQTPLPKGVIAAAELKQLVPQDYFFAGRTASVQLRNAAGVRFPNDKLLLAALVDTSGYSTAIAERYQGLFITESPVRIEGSELKPGAYGFGFKSGKFLLMDVSGADVLSVDSQRDDKLRPAVPLKIAEQDGSYRLYAGKNFVTLKAP